MNYTIVNMKEIKTSKNIILTKGLASCIGVLMYDRTQKKAMIGHFSSQDGGETEEDTVDRIYNSITKEMLIEGMIDNEIEYIIVPGRYIDNERNINIAAGVTHELSQRLHGYSKIKPTEKDIKLDEKTNSLEFAFDPKTGSFITDSFFNSYENLNYSVK